MRKNQCPYCKRIDCIKEVVFTNAINYGSNFYHVPCVYCGKMLHVHLRRIVKVEEITKSKKPLEDRDFS